MAIATLLGLPIFWNLESKYSISMENYPNYLRTPCLTSYTNKVSEY